MTYKELAKKFINISQNKKDDLSFLLFELSGLSATEFYLNFDKEAPKQLEEKFLSSARLYIEESIPIQQILGYAYFYGYKFMVNENTLIPRKETEELVGNVLLFFDKYFNDKISLLDLGTGSGIIGITIKLEEPIIDVDLADISNKALLVAKENANTLEAGVTLIESNWFSNIDKKYDIIVCNPPYIPNDEQIDEVVKHDPHISLFGGTDGLVGYKEVLSNAKNHLKEKSLLAFEHGYDQKERIVALIKQFIPEAKIVSLKDFSGKDRMTFVGLGGVLNDE